MKHLKPPRIKAILLLLILVCSLMTVWSAWQMYALFKEERLWGKLPLWFFLGIWGSIFFTLLFKNREQLLKLKKWLLAALTGLLLWLAFPPMPFAFLAFVAFLPLLLLETQLDKQDKNKKEKFFPYLYLSFTLWNILSTYWIANSALVAGGTAIAINSFFMCLPWLAWRITKTYMPGVGLFILPAYWLAFEYIHFHWQLSWPWLTLGHIFALHPAFVQWYEYTGVLGGSLWIWLGNLAIWQLIALKQFPQKQSIKSKAQKLIEKIRNKPIPPEFLPRIQTIAIFILPTLLSLKIYYTHKEQNSLKKSIETVIIQPNFEPHYQKFYLSQQTQLDTFLSLAERLVSKNTDYLVFPETSFGNIRDNQIGKERITRKLKTWTQQHTNLKLLTGIAAYHLFEKNEPPSPYARQQKNSRGEILYWEAYNAAVQIQAGDDKLKIYKKSKLVPGAEFLPYKKLLFFFKPLVDKLGGSIGGYAPQEKRTPFVCKEKGTAIGTQICYESIYGEFSTGYVREGANLLFIMTNDGWWDNTPGHRQHLWIGRLRAIELRRDIARSANTGISAFINQRGDITQATTYGETTAIKAQLNPNNQITFYARYGDLIGRLASFISALFLFIALVNKLTR